MDMSNKDPESHLIPHTVMRQSSDGESKIDVL